VIKVQEVKTASFDSVSISIDQVLHNFGISKATRYAEIIKLVLASASLRKGDASLKTKSLNSANEIREFVDLQLSLVRDSLPGLKIDDCELEDLPLIAVWTEMSKLSESKNRDHFLQDIFMKFGPTFLRKDLDQFFTPEEVVAFVANAMDFFDGARVIDTAGGSGDFLTGANSVSKFPLDLHHWDMSSEASEIATLNMFIHGISKCNFRVGDSLSEPEFARESFDFVLTNPPFGTKTIWAAPAPLEVMGDYELGHKWHKGRATSELIRQQLGILFIERNLKALRVGGILSIVLPSGYMTNPSESYLRKYLLDNHKILGVISLPAGTFVKSGAGVACNLLLVQKGNPEPDYEIFTGVANHIGFDFKKAATPKIYKRNPIDGSILLDIDGEPLPEDDLLYIGKQLSSFASKNHVQGLRKNPDSPVEYEFVLKSELTSDRDLVLSPKRHTKKYLECLDYVRGQAHTTLREIGASVSQNDNLKIVDTNEYIYLDIGEIGHGTYRLQNRMRGWELPGRAKQSVEMGDILVARLAGSNGKYCMIAGDQNNLVATNGLFKIRIKDETQRLNFLHFLETEEFATQFDCLATGSIMEDVKHDDFISKLLIPVSKAEVIADRMRKIVEFQSELATLSR
jgi:type I restriction enzyme M protein